MVNSPPDSPSFDDDDDVPVPCKGCNNVLEEGKAFELAGNRWHIDCFRCNSCGTLLDSDANLLLLGDGSLICNSCTYSCTACGNKIEDLAILTGDQAFCAGCFRCRNCKRKIENLKYARTSQGIFCMSCHESLMARRKKKQGRPPANTQRTPTSGLHMQSPPMLSLHKSLPSLPVDPADQPSEVMDRMRSDPYRNNSTRSTPDQMSPMGYMGLGLPSSDHHLRTPRTNKRHSIASQTSESSLGLDTAQSGPGGPLDYSFIPLVLDNSLSPAPPLGPAPLPSTAYRPGGDSVSNRSSYYQPPDRQAPRPTYDRKSSAASSYYDQDRERSTRPHIASQDKSYDPQSILESRKSAENDRALRERSTAVNSEKVPYGCNIAQPRGLSVRSQTIESQSNNSGTQKAVGPQGFKLGDVPKEKKKGSATPKSLGGDDSPNPGSHLSRSPSDSTQTLSSQNTYIPPGSVNTNSRAESPASLKKPIESPVISTSSSARSQHSHATSSSSAISTAESPPPRDCSEKQQSGTLQLSSTTTTVSNIAANESPPKSSAPRPPSGSAPRPPNHSHSSSNQENSISTPLSDSHSELSPALPPLHSPIGGLGFDEDIKRVFGSGSGSAESILRRVSNSVKHGRSLSEVTKSPKLRRPASAGYAAPFGDISSPMSPDNREDPASLKQELRRSTQRIAELESKLNSTVSAKALEHNIQEKRNTVALLETERETFLRELMVIKEKLEASKDGKTFNLAEVNSEIIRGVTRELEDLKETLKADIQTLVIQRDQLMEDVENFGRMREQAIQETEQLNMKNAQLADLNNELTRRIQGQFKTNKSAQQMIPGLGIYDGSESDLLEIRVPEKRGPMTQTGASIVSSTSTPINEQNTDSEVFVAEKASTYKTGAARQKRFFWGKPAATVLKGAGKGFNRVFANDGEAANGNDSSGHAGQKNAGNTDATSGKIFGAQKKWGKHKGPSNGASVTLEQLNGHVAIFGGDLEQRVEFEGSPIPNVVQKCIQEVEMRGMDLEGIYRKSGGAIQMRQIQDQFERGEDVVFDPELDICSVTSVLKQYFRNLPNPLITYDMYDRFIDTSTGGYEEEKRIKALREIVEDLPPSHRHVLQFLIFHLARVAARKEENLMNTRNISVVFAPTLLRHTSDEREMSDMHSKNNALQFLIDFNEAIF